MIAAKSTCAALAITLFLVGQVVAKLDTRALKIQEKQAEARLDAEKQSVREQQSGARPEEIVQAKAQLASAQA
ncbi:hypothetical protein [Mixta mediterraneensis]|uniref:hypothetical protein n=1 Tax=Mixta mediterraneensis TaxID=2758443 RepID=UPI0019330F3A|nr:hypothetical protein [Mixta mediterraneensis]